ncbi:MAG TPA: class I tRNA ligase family protein [Streptosporangiaceae bacterium]
MIISAYDAGEMHQAFGIDLSDIDLGAVEEVGVGAAWGRVPPGRRTDPHQHDELETFVIVAGAGDVIVDGESRPVSSGTVIQFEPFETHVLENTGDADLLFATFYWRNPDRAARKAAETGRRRFGDRPVFVFSTPPTPNGDLHLGHLSGPYLATDVYVRFQRMNGANAWHLAATDDYQSYVAERADREGRRPEEVAAHYSAEIRATLELMDIEIHQFNSTSAAAGYRDRLRSFFSRVVASGLAKPREGTALFDGETGAYLYEPYVSGGCPTCGSAAGGNICEECGEPNFCVDLVEPRSSLSGAEPRTGTITRYVLPLHELRADIEAHHRVGRVPARTRELAHRLFQRDRLDMAITHPAEWGVPPVEDGVPAGQVIWDWLDLGYGFLHNIELLGRTLGEDWSAERPESDWKIVHFHGYDNTFYHAILIPALYRLVHPGWTPDIDYHVNEFYELDRSKFSTSRRHAVWGKEVLGPSTVDAVRFHLARTRPEGRRTNFTIDEYEATARDTLAGTWQRWLNDLGERVQRDYGGTVPDAGIWTPEHTAFLARLGTRLSALTGSLGQDGFSLNQAAEALDGIVADVTAFSRRETATARAAAWKDEARTAIALELAAARLLAHGAAPVMPRFGARLAAALGLPRPAEWPRLVELVPPGTRVDLARQVFFGAPPEHSEPSPLAPWLAGQVRELLNLGGEAIDGRTLVELGMESLQSIALQYKILEATGVDITVEELLGGLTIAELAALVGDRSAPDAVTAPAETAPA